MSGREYDVGDVVEYRTFGALRRVRVVSKGEEGGSPVFDGELLGVDGEPVGTTVWGYEAQIVSVERCS